MTHHQGYVIWNCEKMCRCCVVQLGYDTLPHIPLIFISVALQNTIFDMNDIPMMSPQGEIKRVRRDNV